MVIMDTNKDGMVWFFDYGIRNMPVEHLSLSQCHTVWRRYEGGTVKER